MVVLEERLEDDMIDENPNKLASSEQMSTAAHGQPRGVHLVGSVPLGNAEEVFRMVSAIPSLLRIHREVTGPISISSGQQ